MHPKTAEVCICIPSSPEASSESSLSAKSSTSTDSYDQECYICWEEDELRKDPIAVIGCCPHVSYHKLCLLRWLSVRKTCPFCRTEIKYHLTLEDEEELLCNTPIPTITPTPASTPTPTTPLAMNIQQPLLTTTATNSVSAASASASASTSTSTSISPNRSSASTNVITDECRRYMNTVSILRYLACVMSVNFIVGSGYYIVTTY